MSHYVEIGGWRLTTALPDGFEQVRQQLVAEILDAAEGRTVAPMRRSRRAVTYNCRIMTSTNALLVFVKVIASPRGVERLKRMFRGSDAAHVTHITGQIINAGFNAPPVWIWGSHRAAGRELVVTPRASGYGPLRTLSMLTGGPPAKWRLLEALGEEIARFHRAGFVHGDLTPFNLFISPGETPAFVFLDHERTRCGRRWARRQQARNLVQLGRFALPCISTTDRMRVLRAYARARPLDAAAARRIGKMLARRLRRDRGLERVAVPEFSNRSRCAAS